MHASVNAYVQTRTYALWRTYMYICTHAEMYTPAYNISSCTHTRINTCRNFVPPAYVRSYIYTHVQANVHLHTHTVTYAYTHICAYARANTNSCLHASIHACRQTFLLACLTRLCIGSNCLSTSTSKVLLQADLSGSGFDRTAEAWLRQEHGQATSPLRRLDGLRVWNGSM